MMFVFGDAERPLPEVVFVVEKAVKRFIADIVAFDLCVVFFSRSLSVLIQCCQTQTQKAVLVAIESDMQLSLAHYSYVLRRDQNLLRRLGRFLRVRERQKLQQAARAGDKRALQGRGFIFVFCSCSLFLAFLTHLFFLHSSSV